MWVRQFHPSPTCFHRSMHLFFRYICQSYCLEPSSDHSLSDSSEWALRSGSLRLRRSISPLFSPLVLLCACDHLIMRSSLSFPPWLCRNRQPLPPPSAAAEGAPPPVTFPSWHIPPSVALSRVIGPLFSVFSLLIKHNHTILAGSVPPLLLKDYVTK